MCKKWLVACLYMLSLLVTMSPAMVMAQEDTPPFCGAYPNGRPRSCSGNGQGNMEATCLAQARVEICLIYHQFNCQRGFAAACRLTNIGQNCNGGDSQQCKFYQQLLVANRACNLDGNQQACYYLKQQGY